MLLRMFSIAKLSLATGLAAFALATAAAELPDLQAVPKDLETPRMIEGTPSPGTRVKAVTPGYESTAVHHALYL